MTALLYKPAGRDRTAVTVGGSMLLHASVIAVAALYPARYSPPAGAGAITAISYDDAAPAPAVLTIPPAAYDPAEVPPLADADPRPTSVDVGDVTPPDASEIFEMSPVKPPQRIYGASKPAPRSHVRTKLGPSGAAAAVAGAGARAGRSEAGGNALWSTPQPPFPYAMRLARTTGSGRVRITTDSTGHVNSASMLSSTGNRALDENTMQFARMRWTGPPNELVVVPIVYEIR